MTMPQAPILVQQTYLQQIMAQILPYLVFLIIAALTGLAAVVKSYAAKLIAQLQVNKAASEQAASNTIAQLQENKTAADDAAINAQTAATLAAGASIAVATHNKEAMAKLDTLTEQTNGINHRLNDTVAKQEIQIAALKANQEPDDSPPTKAA